MADETMEMAPPAPHTVAEEQRDDWSPGQRRQVLRDRAQQLARVPVAEEGGERLELVEFLLGSEHYGLETSFIREVHPLRELTPLPCVPPFVVGIMNLRGEILSVIDLRNFFEMDRPALTELSKVIVLRQGAMEFGILADAVLGVRTIRSSALQSSLTTLTGVRADYLKGVTGEHLVLLDAGKLLADRRLVVHEEV